jgi:hypothetical protein
MKDKSGCLLVSFDFGNDVPVVIVGEKLQGQDVKVINAFQDQEAIDIINKLTTMKKKGDEEHE